MSEAGAETSAEEVDLGQAPADPTFTQDPTTGFVILDWHGPRPAEIGMSGESLEAFVEDRNAMHRTLREQAEQIARQAEKIANMEMVLTIVRLGRRPSKADWDSVGLVMPPQDVRIEMLRRKS